MTHAERRDAVNLEQAPRSHPLVAELFRTVQGNQPDQSGLLYGTAKGHVILTVSPAALLRAARFTDALLKTLERSGSSVSLSHGDRYGFVVTIAGQDLCIRIREGLRQVRVEQPYERMEFRPSGQLQLFIDEWLDHARKRWADGEKNGNLEDQLEGVLVGLKKAAEKKRILEEERERENHKWEAERMRQEEEQTRSAEEERRGEDVSRCA